MVGFIVEEVVVQVARVDGCRIETYPIKCEEDRRALQLCIILRRILKIHLTRFAKVVLIEYVKNSVFATTDDKLQVIQKNGAARTKVLIGPVVAQLVCCGHVPALRHNL